MPRTVHVAEGAQNWALHMEDNSTGRSCPQDLPRPTPAVCRSPCSARRCSVELKGRQLLPLFESKESRWTFDPLAASLKKRHGQPWLSVLSVIQSPQPGCSCTIFSPLTSPGDLIPSEGLKSHLCGDVSLVFCPVSAQCN